MRGGPVAGHRGGVGQARLLLPVLLRQRPPVVVGHPPLGRGEHGGDAGATGVPLAGTAVEHHALPRRPRQPVGPGGVAGVHAVGFRRVLDEVAAHPQVPLLAVEQHDVVLVRRAIVPREHRAGLRRIERRRGGGVDDVDPPVQAAGRGAADVEAPTALGQRHQRGPLERLALEGVTLEDGQRLELLAVPAAGHHHGVAAAPAHRTAQPVGEVEEAVDLDRTRPTGPVPRAPTGRRHCDRGPVRVGQGDAGGELDRGPGGGVHRQTVRRDRLATAAPPGLKLE